ncbi:MAG: hypothetical protein QXU98_09735 [Candidatus Parvarchaeota archaeon]
MEIRRGTIKWIRLRNSNSFCFGDRIAVLGFIDIHTHEINEIDLYELNKQGLERVKHQLVSGGGGNHGICPHARIRSR